VQQYFSYEPSVDKSVQVDTPFDELDVFSQPIDLDIALSDSETDNGASPTKTEYSTADSDTSKRSPPVLGSRRRRRPITPIPLKVPRDSILLSSLSSRFWTVPQERLQTLSPIRSPRIFLPRTYSDDISDLKPLSSAVGQLFRTRLFPSDSIPERPEDPAQALPLDRNHSAQRDAGSQVNPAGGEAAPDCPSQARPPQAKMHPTPGRVSRQHL
jgi:hypothetical protein